MLVIKRSQLLECLKHPDCSTVNYQNYLKIKFLKYNDF